MLAFAGLSGCYLSRLREEPSDGGVRDAHIDPADARPPPVDAALMCPVVRADFTCLPSFLVQPGRPFTLPLSFDALACCAEAECVVAVDASSQTLRLTSMLCADTCGCAATNTPVAECAVPALSPGSWLVEVNGSVAYRLPVMEDSGLVPPPPTCVNFQEPDPCMGRTAISEYVGGAVACAQQAPFATRYWIELIENCSNCTRESTCTVRLEPRLTADLPLGGDLHVTPLRFHGECDPECSGVCVEQTRRCEAPPLEDGRYYRVFVDDTMPLAFTAGRDTRICGSESRP